jgi:hypothetical protein
MAKNLLDCLGRFSPQQIDLIIIALAPYCGLTPAQLKQQNWQAQIGFSSPQRLKRALINAVDKGRLTFSEAQEIASIIGVSLYNR